MSLPDRRRPILRSIALRLFRSTLESFAMWPDLRTSRWPATASWNSSSADPGRDRRPHPLHAAGQGTRRLAKHGQAVPRISRRSARTSPRPRRWPPPRPTPRCSSYAEEELAALRAPAAGACRPRLEDFLLVEPGEDFGSIIMEIRAGTGGDEAALFAGDLYNMYTHYARDQGWKVEDISFSPGEQGGYKEVVFSVTGDDVLPAPALRERRPSRPARAQDRAAGPHPHLGRHGGRAARAGRGADRDHATRTSSGRRMRAGGAGGQHVNKTESAVRIWYKQGTPEEMEVKCQDERSQHKNYDRAMRILRSRLYERQQQKLHRERAEQRRTLIGSGDRSERIRTYNFPQNRVTDHRINLNLYKLDAIIAGNLGELIQALQGLRQEAAAGAVTRRMA